MLEKTQVPWTTRRSNQSVLQEINPEFSLEGLRLKLKRQYFGHLMQTDNPLENSDAGKDWGQKEKRVSEDEMAGWHYWCNEHELGQTPGDGEGQGGLACCSPWGHKGWTWLGSWTTTITATIGYFIDFWTLYKIMQYVSCVSHFLDSTLCLGFTHDVVYSSWLFIFITVE